MDLENRPMMLKDFLGYYNSCNNASSSSSNRFRKSTAVVSSRQPSIVLLRSRSKRAAATTISAIQKVINVVRFFQFESVKSPPSVLRRQKLMTETSHEEMAKVKVKDILRWRSFRDLEEEQKRSAPSNSPDPRVSISSDGDEELADSWVDANQESDNWSVEESDSEQQSPVSVLYSPFQQVPMKFSNKKNAAPDSDIEERARRLLSGLGEPEACKTGLDWNLVMDYYMDEVMSGKAEDFEVLNAVRSWMNGDYSEMYEWEMEDNRKAYIEDMEKGISWIKFKQELEEISRELEFELLDDLLLNFLAE